MPPSETIASNGVRYDLAEENQHSLLIKKKENNSVRVENLQKEIKTVLYYLLDQSIEFPENLSSFHSTV